MASSSKAPYNIPLSTADQEVEQGEEEEKDWLELTLGSGLCSASAEITPSSASSSSSLQPLKQTKLGLGLGAGCNETSISRDQSFIPPQLLPIYRHDHELPLTSPSTFLMDSSRGSFLGLHYPFRPQCGLWFTLRSSSNWNGEVALPQIPKAYIRVKDDNVTVFMVKTYLVTKLGLSNEAQIDISCMGRRLLHSQTLKHVRDAIWLPILTGTMNSRAPLIPISEAISLNHLMSLDYYGIQCFPN